MRRKAKDHSEAIGTDAFLDIVANLVGILLILIMVIGVRMDDASQTARVASIVGPPNIAALMPPALVELPEFPPVEIPNVEAAQLEFTRLESSIRAAQSETEQLANLMRVQKLDRDNLMLAVTHAEHVLEQRKEALSEESQATLQQSLLWNEAENHYQKLVGQLDTISTALKQQRPEVIQHIATPLAKTVFVREEHFRLKEGRLVFVPLNSMTSQLKREAPNKMWKLKTTSQTTETIGPEDGFSLRYTLRRNRVPERTEQGVVARDIVELDRFVMVPVNDRAGETIDEALQPGSQFRTRLENWTTRDTIITVWTYPDSFEEFRQLKGALYQQGFLTAARPLPVDQLISGSPNGTRSAAQ